MKHLVLILLATLVTTGCASREPEVRSPRWNKDTCAHCRMAVSSPRFAAQLVGTGGQVRHYDDLGCLVRDQAQKPDLLRLVPYVMAPEKKGVWVEAEEARFTDGMSTPMDFGFGPAVDGTLSLEAVRARILADEAR